MNLRSLLAPLGALLLAGFTHAPPNPARDDYAATMPARTVRIDVLANDRMPQATAHLIAALPARNGTARIERGEVSYVPRRGFKGTDQFLYLVAFRGAKSSAPSFRDVPTSEAKLIAWMARQPRDALKGLGLGRVKIDVDPSAKAVRVQGRVYDGPIPGAIVSASVGDNDFDTQADANGNYALRLFGVGGDQFVTLRADGVSPTGAIAEFVSHAGSLARLAREAGSDGTLTRDENPQVQVTNLSTAAFVLTNAANGNEDVSSEEQLRIASQAVDVSTLLTLAAATQLVVDGGVPLPAGFDSATELISNRAAVDAFIKALPAGRLDASIAALSQDPAITTGFVDDDIVGQPYALVLPSKPGTINVANVGGEILLDLAAGGGGEALIWQANAAPGVTWTMDGDGVVEVVRTAPNTWTYRTPMFEPGCLGKEFEVSDTHLRYRLQRLYSQANVDSLKATWTARTVFSDLEPSDDCEPPPSPGVVSADVMMLGMRYPDGWIPFAPTASSRARLITYNVSPPPGVFDSIAGLFDLGSGRVIDGPGVSGVEDAVVRADGVMTITLRRSADALPVQVALGRVQQDGHKGDGVLAVITYPDGTRSVKHALSAEVDGSLTFTATNLRAAWRSGFEISAPPPAPGEPFAGSNTFSIVLGAGASGHIESVFTPSDGSPPQLFTIPFTWMLDGIRMKITGGTAPRYWVPIAASGNIDDPATPVRIYVLENRDGYRRPNFYERNP